MTVTFQLPPDIERTLRSDLADLNAEAKEAFLVALYRRGKISRLDLSGGLGLDRFETDDLLHKHHVTEDLGNVGDYLADIETLETLRTKNS